MEVHDSQGNMETSVILQFGSFGPGQGEELMHFSSGPVSVHIDPVVKNDPSRVNMRMNRLTHE